MGSDSDAALDNTVLSDFTNPSNRVKGIHLDLVNSLRTLKKISTYQIDGKKIIGHRDKAIPFHLLTWWEQRNVEMDILAKTYMQNHRKSYTADLSTARSPHEIWSVYIDGGKVTSDISRFIHDKVRAKKLLKYYSRPGKGRFPISAKHTIAWDNVEKCMKELPLHRQLWLSKQISGFCGTGYRMQQWKKRDTACCPLCTNDEDNIHVLTCKSEATTEKWTEQMEMLEIKLIGMNTPEEFIQIIIFSLSSWRNGSVVRIPDDNEALLVKAARAQTELGWLLFLEGCLATQWSDYVSTFMIRQQCPHKWLRQLIHQLWSVVFALWDNRCQILHKSDLSNSLHQMEAIDRKILTLLNKDITLLLPSESMLFRYSESLLMSKPAKFRKEWYHKATIAYNRGMNRLHNPKHYRSERDSMRTWLGGANVQQTVNRPEIQNCSPNVRQTRITNWFGLQT